MLNPKHNKDFIFLTMAKIGLTKKIRLKYNKKILKESFIKADGRTE
jgi:hypothetical protein